MTAPLGRKAALPMTPRPIFWWSLSCSVLGVLGACSQPAPAERSQAAVTAPDSARPAHAGLRAPFTLTLRPVDAAPPSVEGKALGLVAELRLPEGARAPLSVSLRVDTPAGVRLVSEPPKAYELSPAQGPQYVALSFSCETLPTADRPIVVTARYAAASGTLGATAERRYPAPPAPAPGDTPTGTADPGPTRNLGMLPIGQSQPLPRPE